MVTQVQYSTENIAQSLTENTVAVLRCHTGLKRPHADPSGTWDTCADPDQVCRWIQPPDNLAMLLGWTKDSPIIGVGLDVYKNRQALDRAKELGVTFKGSTWSQRTGRGGYTLFYVYDAPVLKRDTSGCDGALDLLVSGYSLIAPSNTSREQQGGGPYKWLPGHSPLEISLGELDEPPKDLLVWWQSLGAQPQSTKPARVQGESESPAWLTDVIPDGQRNETLTKIAGCWHWKLTDGALVRHLVHQANGTHCRPPLNSKEVDGVVDSILKREGGTHFRGVQAAPIGTNNGA